MNDKMLQSQLKNCHIYYLYDVGFDLVKIYLRFLLDDLANSGGF